MDSDSNFLKENNAKHMWHPMAHPAEMRAHAPQMITKAEGVQSQTLTVIQRLTRLGGFGALIWAIALTRLRKRSVSSWMHAVLQHVSGHDER